MGALIKHFYIALGYISLSAGLMLFLLPIPLGIPLIALGIMLLLRYSAWFRRGFLYWYRREPRLRNLLWRLRRRKQPSRR